MHSYPSICWGPRRVQHHQSQCPRSNAAWIWVPGHVVPLFHGEFQDATGATPSLLAGGGTSHLNTSEKAFEFDVITSRTKGTCFPTWLFFQEACIYERNAAKMTEKSRKTHGSCHPPLHSTSLYKNHWVPTRHRYQPTLSWKILKINVGNLANKPHG